MQNIFHEKKKSLKILPQIVMMSTWSGQMLHSGVYTENILER